MEFTRKELAVIQTALHEKMDVLRNQRVLHILPEIDTPNKTDYTAAKSIWDRICSHLLKDKT